MTSSGPSLIESADAPRLRRRSTRFGVLAVLFCPCHLPLMAALLGAVGFAGAATAVSQNFGMIFAALLLASAAAVLFAVRASRQARTCALPPPPIATSQPPEPVSTAQARR